MESSNKITDFINKEIPDIKVYYYATTDSTNTRAKEDKNNDKISLYIAERQHGGRGRYNRLFDSSDEGGLYFSLKFSGLSLNHQEITLFPIISALSVCEILSGQGIEIKIKWPNDILYGAKKLCGILTEAAFDSESQEIKYLISGIGINVNNESFNEGLNDIASSVFIVTGKKQDKYSLLIKIIKRIILLLSCDKNAILSAYKDYLITDKAVSFTYNNEKMRGIIKTVDENGNLSVDISGTEMILTGGEISFS